MLRESQANHNNTSKNYHLQSNQQHHEYFRRHAINQSFRINNIVLENKKKCAMFFFGKEGDCHNFSQTSEINDFYLKIFLKRRFPNFGVVLIQ